MTKKVVYQGKFINVIDNNTWEYVSRAGGQYAVSICAITPNKEIILVEQLRVPVEKNVIESPAGLVGDQDENESALESAKRELLEEAGYESNEWTELYTSTPSPGITDEMSVKMLATNCVKVGEGGGVDEENITVHLVPIKSLITWADRQRKQGKMVDGGIFSGLYYYQQGRGFDPN